MLIVENNKKIKMKSFKQASKLRRKIKNNFILKIIVNLFMMTIER